MVDNLLGRQMELDQQNSEQQLERILQNYSQNNGEDITRLQSQWTQVYSDTQTSVDEQLLQRVIDGKTAEQDILENIIDEVYTQDYKKLYQQGYLDALSNIVTATNESGKDKIAVKDIEDMIEEFEEQAVEPDVETLENAKSAILLRLSNETETVLNGITIDWNQLQIITPSIPLSYTDGRNDDDGIEL